MKTSFLLAKEFKHIGGRLCMKGFPERWIIILGAVYPRRNFPHTHLVSGVGASKAFIIANPSGRIRA
jgi:hypothetical protein